MKTQNPLRTSLLAVLSLAFFLVSYSSFAAATKNKNQIAISNPEAEHSRPSKNPGNFNLVVPDLASHKTSTPTKKPGHSPEKTGTHPAEKTAGHAEKGHHSDEEKHDNHVYHYDWVKRSRKIIADLLCFAIKIFVAITYLSVLICGYLSIIH